MIAAIRAGRPGRAPDVVATIAADQDQIIRDELAGVVVVQGAPGTGKTVVALHRAAYLLYTHRGRLGRSGVLVVGPSTRFLEHIGDVVPSLGESAVVLATHASLLPGVTVTRRDPWAVAALKGDARMATVLARAVRAHQRIPRRPVIIRLGSVPLRIDRAAVRAARDEARGSGLAHNRARAVFATALADRLVADCGDATRRPAAVDVRDLDAFRSVVAALWPTLTPEMLVSSLRGDEAVRIVAARDVLEPDEVALLVDDGDRDSWSDADVALLDEARVLLGPPPVRRRRRDRHPDRAVDFAADVITLTGTNDLVDPHLLAARYHDPADDETVAARARLDPDWCFGHVIVDEAQDLSSMQWRAVVRRCPTRSMTVVGDIDQGTAPAAASSWEEALRPHLRRGWRTVALRINYRTPAEISAVASEVWRAAGIAAPDVDAVRHEGTRPRMRASSAAEVLPAAVAEVTIALDAVSGTVAAIAPRAQVGELEHALQVAGGPGDGGAEARLKVLAADEVKGLEFDAVVVVDADRTAASSPRGTALLYVALTRARRHLSLVVIEQSPLVRALAGLVDVASDADPGWTPVRG